RNKKELADKIRSVLKMLKKSKRPVILAGYGIKAAGAEKEFKRLIERLLIPVLTTRRGADLLPAKDKKYFGRPGTYGQRSANFIIQNSDLLISIGARLSLPLIGRNYKTFARAAKKVIVDIDPQELDKATVAADLTVLADAGEFTKTLLDSSEIKELPDRKNWIKCCQKWCKVFSGEKKRREIDPYHFVKVLSGQLNAKETVVVDGGVALDFTMQSFRFKTGQRLIASTGLEQPGFALPGSIGVFLVSRPDRIICLSDTKSLQSNIAELKTIASHKLPIKIFVFNSKTDAPVQSVQETYFGRRYVGLDQSFDVAKTAKSFGVSTLVVKKNKEMEKSIKQAITRAGPVLCEVALPEDQEMIPRMVFKVTADGRWSSPPLEDMYPFLDRKTLKKNMLIDILEEE
ncbi:thiamine pyrophosphate-binding protein, partial [Candidatus Margulisiibacteriota bacterium]